jgi:hypothetical protein
MASGVAAGENRRTTGILGGGSIHNFFPEDDFTTWNFAARAVFLEESSPRSAWGWQQT